MRAVNLMPAGSGRRTRETASSLPFVAMLGGLVIVLVAIVLYVLAHNSVTSRESKLAAIQANTARWTAAADSYSGDVTTAAQRAATITSVESLVGDRADWSKLLDQLSKLMPAQSKLTTLSASGSGAASATPSSSTSSSGSTSSAATTTTSSAISLAGCAASQNALAQTMINLRRITGVSQVTLGSDSQTAKTAAAASGGSGSCPYRVTYALNLTFVPPTFSVKASPTAAGASTTTTASGVSQ